MDRDTAFQGSEGCGEAFAFEPEGRFVFFEILVDSGGTDAVELSRDFGSDAEGRPGGDGVHLLPREGREDFPALVPEEGPDEAEAAEGLI